MPDEKIAGWAVFRERREERREKREERGVRNEKGGQQNLYRLTG